MKTLTQHEQIFKALSDKSRLRILKMLQRKSLCVCEMTDILKLATSTVSKHLSILRDAGLIIDEKDKKWINYRINPKPKTGAVSNAILFIMLQLEDDEVIRNDEKLISIVDRNVLCCK
jgi:ArsR family transcriptional regulator, arsenate/arsenite/antimonite-responsive transcriptional repressor